MSRPLWFVELLKKAFPQRFRLAALTRLPLFGHALDQMLFGGDDIIYLPQERAIRVKDGGLEAACSQIDA